MEFKTLNNIAQVHALLGLPEPEHPLVSVVKNDTVCFDTHTANFKYVFNVYVIAFKTGMTGQFGYGRSLYDFTDGTLIFIRPGQVFTGSQITRIETTQESWSLYVHPDLFRHSSFQETLETYSFFFYSLEEGLHLSALEKNALNGVIEAIQHEYANSTDAYTHPLITAHFSILLSYCSRYFDRQFQTRTKINKGTVSAFYDFLKAYFQSDQLTQVGLPSVQFCGKQLGLSPNYLSDLLKRETGRNAQEHIYECFIEKAKTWLISSSLSVKQIAYQMGFTYPQHFSKLFKSKTGLSPSAYRTLSE